MRPSRLTLATMLFATTFAYGCESDDDVSGESIGPRGGTVVSSDGRLVLEVPAGALDHEVEISIEIEQGPEGAMSPTYVLSPAGVGFERPVELMYDYDDAQMVGHDAEAIEVLVEGNNGWSYLGDREVDDEDQVVSASLLYLSSVTVVAEG